MLRDEERSITRGYSKDEVVAILTEKGISGVVEALCQQSGLSESFITANVQSNATTYELEPSKIITLEDYLTQKMSLLDRIIQEKQLGLERTFGQGQQDIEVDRSRKLEISRLLTSPGVGVKPFLIGEVEEALTGLTAMLNPPSRSFRGEATWQIKSALESTWQYISASRLLGTSSIQSPERTRSL